MLIINSPSALYRIIAVQRKKAQSYNHDIRGINMEMAQYLDRLLLRYSGTFDIYKPYFIDGKEYPAYGYFFSHLEKYVLVREANLWASDSYEHILFITADKITEEHVKEAQDVIQNYMEPKLVRKGARVPEKDHMYSFLTVILLSQYPPDRNTLKSVKRYSFDKGYRFNLRGFSTGHMALGQHGRSQDHMQPRSSEEGKATEGDI